METIKEIVVFFSQFLIVIMPLVVLIIFIILIKYILYTNKDDDHSKLDSINSEYDSTYFSSYSMNKETFNSKKIDLEDLNIEQLEECIKTKESMTIKTIEKEIENLKKEKEELIEEKKELEKTLIDDNEKEEVLIDSVEEVKEEIIVKEEQAKGPIENIVNILKPDKREEQKNISEELVLSLKTKIKDIEWKLKRVKTVKEWEKLKKEFDKLKKQKEYVKKEYYDLERKLNTKYEELTIKKPKAIVNNPDNQVKKERLEKVNKIIKINENKSSVLVTSLCYSVAAISNVIKKKKNTNKPVNKPKRVILKPNVNKLPINNIQRMTPKPFKPKGELKVFNKPKKRSVLTRITNFVNNRILLPMIIRLERIQRLEHERKTRNKREEIERIKQMKIKLEQVKRNKINNKRQGEKPKVKTIEVNKVKKKKKKVKQII